jgi:radical SAM superfamily enzyme YgiQ (UPF0313 family)
MDDMKILLVNTPTLDLPIARDMMGGLGLDRGDEMVLPPLELAYLGAAIRSCGHEIEIIDPDTEGISFDQTLDRSLNNDWDVAICTASLPTLRKDSDFIRELRARTGRKVLVQTNITQLPVLEELLRESTADFGLFGECELIIGEILAGSTRQGTIRLQDGSLQASERQVVQEMDRLPMPARDCLPNDRYWYPLLGDYPSLATVQTSRGCPFKCAYYCPYPLVQGKAWRARSPRHVLEELIEVQNKYAIPAVLFRDAVFTLDQDRTREICAGIVDRGLSLRWWCETRADFLDESLLEAMRKAGCDGINVGVETGDPEVLRTEAKVGLTHDRLARTVQNARGLGIKVHFLLMVGLPGETRKSLYLTHRLVHDLRPDSIGVTIVTPYPGTPLYEEAREKGWIESTEWREFGGSSAVIHTDHLSSQDLDFAKGMILKLFYRQTSPKWTKRLRHRALSARFRKWAEEAGSHPVSPTASPRPVPPSTKGASPEA